MARGPENKIINRENVGTVMEWGGIAGAIIGLVTLRPVVVLFGAGSWIGGRWVKNSAKQGQGQVAYA